MCFKIVKKVVHLVCCVLHINVYAHIRMYAFTQHRTCVSCSPFNKMHHGFSILTNWWSLQHIRQSIFYNNKLTGVEECSSWKYAFFHFTYIHLTQTWNGLENAGLCPMPREGNCKLTKQNNRKNDWKSQQSNCVIVHAKAVSYHLLLCQTGK